MQEPKPAMKHPTIIEDTVSQDQEQALVENAKAGDQTAYMALWDPSRDSVTATVRSILRQCPNDVPDLVQEVWIKGWESIDQYRNSGSFSAWLCKIAVHLSIDFIRKRRGRSRKGPRTDISIDDEAQFKNSFDQEISSKSRRPTWNQDVASWMLLAKQFFGELSRRDQDILTMTVAGYSAKEIADQLGLNPELVSQVRRQFKDKVDRVKDKVDRAFNEKRVATPIAK